jgi:hypothetical protein
MNNIIQLDEKRQLAAAVKGPAYDPLTGEGRLEIISVAREAALSAIAALMLLHCKDDLTIIAHAAFRAAHGVELQPEESVKSSTEPSLSPP